MQYFSALFKSPSHIAHNKRETKDKLCGKKERNGKNLDYLAWFHPHSYSPHTWFSRLTHNENEQRTNSGKMEVVLQVTWHFHKGNNLVHRSSADNIKP